MAAEVNNPKPMTIETQSLFKVLCRSSPSRKKISRSALWIWAKWISPKQILEAIPKPPFAAGIGVMK